MKKYVLCRNFVEEPVAVGNDLSDILNVAIHSDSDRTCAIWTYVPRSNGYKLFLLFNASTGFAKGFSHCSFSVPVLTDIWSSISFAD